MSLTLRYEGTVSGFRLALREIRKAAMRQQSMTDPEAMQKLQRRLRAVEIRDLRNQILSGGGDAA